MTKPITDALAAERNIDAALPGWTLRQEDRRGPFWKWTTSTAEWQIYMLDGRGLRLRGPSIDAFLPVTHCAALIDLAVNLGAIERDDSASVEASSTEAPVGRCNNCHRATHIPSCLGRRCNANTSGGGAVCDGTLVDLDHASLKGSTL